MPSGLLTHLLSNLRLRGAEEGEIDMHLGHRCGGGHHRQMSLFSGLFVKLVDQIVAIHHDGRFRPAGLMDRLRSDSIVVVNHRQRRDAAVSVTTVRL